MKGHKKSNVKKHRGNPHGNAPNPDQSSLGKQNKVDRLQREGVAESEKLKQ